MAALSLGGELVFVARDRRGMTERTAEKITHFRARKPVYASQCNGEAVSPSRGG
jgi:hypothetical protein